MRMRMPPINPSDDLIPIMGNTLTAFLYQPFLAQNIHWV